MTRALTLSTIIAILLLQIPRGAAAGVGTALVAAPDQPPGSGQERFTREQLDRWQEEMTKIKARDKEASERIARIDAINERIQLLINKRTDTVACWTSRDLFQWKERVTQMLKNTNASTAEARNLAEKASFLAAAYKSASRAAKDANCDDFR